jgi:hypothetical protein
MQLNMFWASSCPSSGATTTAVAASGLPSELGDSSAVGRGRAVNERRVLLQRLVGKELFISTFLITRRVIVFHF